MSADKKVQSELKFAFDQFLRGFRSVEYTRGVFNTLSNLSEMMKLSQETINLICQCQDAVSRYEFDMQKCRKDELKTLRNMNRFEVAE